MPINRQLLLDISSSSMSMCILNPLIYLRKVYSETGILWQIKFIDWAWEFTDQIKSRFLSYFTSWLLFSSGLEVSSCGVDGDLCHCGGMCQANGECTAERRRACYPLLARPPPTCKACYVQCSWTVGDRFQCVLSEEVPCQCHAW